ncbi:MAG: UvrD-helicase domain-containing protein [Propionibacteriaceae bacterium]|nr:UvrD-helicase domain-containing protein [Propionibacteriaceae bacterium]
MVTSDFSFNAALPKSTLLLEASAGTGKTFTIAGLAVRYIAEDDLDISELLIITFSNNAAAELRSRVFTAIESCITLLRAGIPASELPSAEPAARYLASLGRAEEFIERLERALDNFDRAAVFTIHSFCQLTLREMGVLGNANSSEALSPTYQLIDECAADSFVARYHTLESPPFPAWKAIRLAHEACRNSLTLAPEGSEEAQFGAAVREMFTARKSKLGVLTFDDLINRMSEVLQHPVTGDMAKQWLRDTYRVVLVDEFQDTDKDQWAIIESAFVAEDRPTILIGDPKQSIYGFRKADLRTYLQASAISTRQSLAMNYRSDDGVVNGVVELMEGIPLGDASIQVQPVGVCHSSRLELNVDQRVWVRQARGSRAQERVLDDLVAQVDSLLGTPCDGACLEASDIAVLVRSHAVAHKVAERLTTLGYPAVLFGATNIWKQQAAKDWEQFLRALSPDGGSAASFMALTDLVGMSLEELGSPDGATRLAEMVGAAQRALTDDGPGAALDVLRERTELEARLIARPGGDRYVADLMHIGELLDQTGHADPVSLMREIEQLRNAGDDAGLRVATDAPAIKVMTLHSAKGLEFPVVLIPDMSTLWHFPNNPFHVHIDGERQLWMQPGKQHPSVNALAMRGARDEELRLLYVGLTRAKHLAVAWQTDDGNADHGPLAALMFRDREKHALEDRYAWRDVRPFKHVLVEEVPNDVVAPHNRRATSHLSLHLAKAARCVDQQWRRTSYSGLTQGLHDAPSGADEPETGEDVIVDDALTLPAPMGPLPAGAAFGTLVHESLEVLDWASPGRTARIEDVVNRLAVTLTDEERATLAQGLEAVVTTPLRPLTSASLSEIPIALRLAELDFDMPMGGDAPATVAELASLMQQHLSDDDPLVEYPALLAASEASGQVLSGMLTGSIDAVLQTDEGKFIVVDYKTNRLAPSASDVLTVGHYTQDAMVKAMMAAHYPLQAICYSAALHRYLQLRLPEYEPERHLGGVGYLFVRGMAGPDTPLVGGHACGVFSWYPPTALVTSVSDLLGGTHA